MADTIKFTEEEMLKVKSIARIYNEITVSLGRLAMQRVDLESQLMQLDTEASVIKDRFIKIQEEERALANELQTKYGDGTLNPETGEFKPKAVVVASV